MLYIPSPLSDDRVILSDHVYLKPIPQEEYIYFEIAFADPKFIKFVDRGFSSDEKTLIYPIDMIDK